MTTHASTARSTAKDATTAGKQAVQEAMEGLPDGEADLLLVFATAGYDQEALLAGMAKAAGGTPLVGCTGEGVITREGSDEGSRSVGCLALASDSLSFHPISATGLAEGSLEAGRAIGQALAEHPTDQNELLLLLPDGLTVNSDQLFAGIQEAAGRRVPLVGGTSGEMMKLTQTFQYHDDQLMSDAAVAVLVQGPFEAEIGVSHGCQPVGLSRTVTKAEGNLVQEIDGTPAFEVFKEYFDDDPEELRGEDIVHMCFGEELPETETEGYDRYIIRTPLGLEAETGALHFPVELAAGTSIQMTRRDPDAVSANASKMARQVAGRREGQTPLAVFQFDCAGRGQVLFGDKTDGMVIDPLQQAFDPEVPWIGLHTYGEIAPLRDVPRFHNYTVALLALYEGEAV